MAGTSGNDPGATPNNDKGIPPHNSSGKTHTPTEADAGYCYLTLFAGRLHAEAISALGEYPTVASVRRFANSRADPFTTITVGLVVGVMDGTVVGHVTAGTIRPSTVLAALDKHLQLGADSTDKVVTTLGTEGAGGGPAAPGPMGGGGLLRKVPFALVLRTDGGQANATIDFARMTGTEALFGAFESVTLAGVTTSATVRGDATTMATMSYTTDPTPPSELAGWMATEVGMMAGGADGEVTRANLELPPDHSFGREIKGIAVGNAPPLLHLGVESQTPAQVFYRGYVTVALSGVGNMRPLILAPNGAPAVVERRSTGRSGPSKAA